MAVDELDAMSLIPLETPVLKVSRPVAACSRCRNAKIKCDGKLPACTSCEKNGRAAECTSTNDQFARGKERSYVSTLETRIDKLQAKLDEAQARKPSVVSIADDETTVPSRRESEQVDEPPTPNTSRKLKRKEVSAIDDLVSDFGFLSVNATARDFYGFTSAMSYARLILSACTKDELPKVTTKALPPRHVANTLIQHYLSSLFVLLPVFDESSFYGSVENVYSQDTRKASPLDHWLVRMVLAVASASMSRQKGDQHSVEGICHVCAALEYAESVLHPGNIYGLQALLLLTEYAMLDPRHFDSWSLIGAVSRAMADLGLHQDPPKGTAMPRSKLELRRKVFHCIYALDRSTSLVQTRAFSFSDDSAKVKVPFHKQASSAPTSPQPGASSQQSVFQSGHEHALDLVNLRKIQSAWYTDLFQSGRERWEDAYSYLWNKCDDMRKWFENLSPSTPPNLLAFFELDLLYSYIYVLSSSPRVPNVVPFAQKLTFEYSIRYAELMLQVITDPAFTTPLTFYDAMRVYMTGRQFLEALQHSTDVLLDGFIPPHPEVKPTAAPPPPMPVVPPPPGETASHFSTIRSINCITNIAKCLELFGIRWGYMSWSQRFQKDTSAMLEQLHQRLQDLDNLNGMRKQSMWQGSIGSLPSSNGSISHPPSHQIVPTLNGYQQSPPQAPPNMNYVANTGGSQNTSPIFQQQANPYLAQHQGPHNVPLAQLPRQYVQRQGAPFSFNDPFSHSTSAFAAPNQQFAAWTGYTHRMVQDALEEENAGRRTSIAWNELTNPRPLRDGVTDKLPLRKLISASSTQPPVPQQSSRFPPLCPKTPPLVPSASREPFTAQSHASPPERCGVSMHDAAIDILESTCTTAVARTYAPAPDLAAVARARKTVNRRKGKKRAKEEALAAMRLGSSLVPPRNPTGNERRDKGKGRAREYDSNDVPQNSSLESQQAAPQAITIPGYQAPGFVYYPDLGYTCTVCGRIFLHLQQTGQHFAFNDGSACFDVPPPDEQFAPSGGMDQSLQTHYPARMQATAGPPIPSGSGNEDLRLTQVGSSDSAWMGNSSLGGTTLVGDEECVMGNTALAMLATDAERRLSAGAGLFF